MLSSATTGFPKAVGRFYIKVCPLKDPWNTAYYIYVGTSGSTVLTGAGSSNFSTGDFVIMSYGRNGTAGPTYRASIYTTSSPLGGMYTMNKMSHFDYDLVAWNGSWVVAPRAAQLSGS